MCNTIYLIPFCLFLFIVIYTISKLCNKKEKVKNKEEIRPIIKEIIKNLYKFNLGLYGATYKGIIIDINQDQIFYKKGKSINFLLKLNQEERKYLLRSISSYVKEQSIYLVNSDESIKLIQRKLNNIIDLND